MSLPQSQRASAKLGEMFEELDFRTREIELKSGLSFRQLRSMDFIAFY
jgi:hypothetical protein